MLKNVPPPQRVGENFEFGNNLENSPPPLFCIFLERGVFEVKSKKLKVKTRNRNGTTKSRRAVTTITNKRGKKNHTNTLFEQN